MKYIDPHIHMFSRTTNDYQAMKKSGIVAVIEPSFWLGQPRTNVGSFIDYFSAITEWEPFRASQFEIRHYSAIGLNPKEANNKSLAREVMQILPEFAKKNNVVAIGEIGYDEQTKNEDQFFRLQIELAKQLGLPIIVHTPHRDKLKGTLRSMDVLEEHKINPKKVVIDHNTEETVEATLSRGYWAGFTIYPDTKMSSERMSAVVKKYGPNRIIVNSSADWGVSDPLSVPKTAQLMHDNGISEKAINDVCYSNALSVYSQNTPMQETDWLKGIEFDQSNLLEGNSVLRGQEPKKSVASAICS